MGLSIGFLRSDSWKPSPSGSWNFSNWRLSELPCCIGHVARNVCSCVHFVLSCRLTLRRQFQGVISPGDSEIFIGASHCSCRVPCRFFFFLLDDLNNEVEADATPKPT